MPPLSLGPNLIVNQTWNDATNASPVGSPETLEAVNNELHIVASQFSHGATVNTSPTIQPGQKLYFDAYVRVISGAVGYYYANGGWPPQMVFGAQDQYYRWQHIARMNGGAFPAFVALVPNTEFYLGPLNLSTVLSGGVFVAARSVFKYIDRDNDSRQFSFPIVDANAASHDARLAQHQALAGAIDAIVKCVRERDDFVIETNVTGAAKPTAGSAQVNIEWKVTYSDDVTGDVETVRLPGANLDISGILQPASNVANLAETTMAAFVTAFEALVLSQAGNAVSVVQVEFLE